MLKEQCPYTVLGVERTASKEEIIKSYRRLAMKWHPDRHLDLAKKEEAEKKFKEIQKAVSTLTDDVARKSYDSSTSASNRSSTRAYSESSPHGRYETDMRRRQDKEEREARHRREAMPKGEDIRKKVVVSVEQAMHGGWIEIQEAFKKPCRSCGGNRVHYFTCRTCRGSGRIRARVCDGCHGEGVNYEECKTCDGKGYLNKTQSIKVKTPSGCIDGTELIVKERGKESTSGGLSGDLIITLVVKAAKGWKCKGADLYGSIKISYSTAMLGGNVEVLLPTGKTVQVNIPPRTYTGKRIRLPGYGLFDSYANLRGDVILQTAIALPR